MRKLLSSVAAVLVLFGIAAILFWFQWARSVFAGIGGILLWAVFYYLAFPQRAKIIFSDIASLVSFLGRNVRRFRVKNQVEGYINTVTDEFNSVCPGATQYPMKLVWVTKELAPRSYIEHERVIVRLKYNDPAYLNTVAAAMAYCHAGLLPDTRQYVRKPLLRAIDLEVVDLILYRYNMRDGQRYFRDEVIPTECQHYKDIQSRLDVIKELEDRGYFRRILLTELAKYPSKANFAICDESHRREICDFVAFLGSIAELPPRGEVNLDFVNKRLQVGVIIVGIPSKLLERGHVPYITQIERCRDRGAEVVYLIGVKGAAKEIPGIAREAAYLGLVDVVDLRKMTRIKYRDGTNVSGYYAQLEVKQLA